MKSVQIPVILDGLNTLKDKSIKLVFQTREFSGAEVAELLKYRDAEGWLLFAPNPFDEKTNIPKESADSGKGEGKSPSQRLRAVLYVMWEQKGKPTDTFEEYYRIQMEKVLEQLKSRLED